MGENKNDKELTLVCRVYQLELDMNSGELIPNPVPIDYEYSYVRVDDMWLCDDYPIIWWGEYLAWYWKRSADTVYKPFIQIEILDEILLSNEETEITWDNNMPHEYKLITVCQTVNKQKKLNEKC